MVNMEDLLRRLNEAERRMNYAVKMSKRAYARRKENPDFFAEWIREEARTKRIYFDLSLRVRREEKARENRRLEI